MIEDDERWHVVLLLRMALDPSELSSFYLLSDARKGCLTYEKSSSCFSCHLRISVLGF